MKKLNLFLMCCVAMAALSCSSDDENTLATNSDPDGVNEQEETLLDITAITNDVSIEGATLIEGSPVPTGDVAFSLDYETQTAFQIYGFDIEFEAPDDFAGVYIQLKDENGVADSYFDVPANATSGVYNKTQKTGKRGYFGNKKDDKRNLASKNDDTSIDVNFGSAVSAGTFCYLICVYDGQGYISEPSEVCVTVESWGGNVNLVADWDFTKAIENGETINVGVEYCEEGYSYSSSLECDNGETLEYTNEYCSTIDGFIITFNSDGTYSYISEDIDNDFDRDASIEACESVYTLEERFYSSAGKWAFNEEESKLTLVEFEYTESNNGETYSGLEEAGYLLFDDQTSVTADDLVITETFTYDGVEEVNEYHFVKQ